MNILAGGVTDLLIKNKIYPTGTAHHLQCAAYQPPKSRRKKLKTKKRLSFPCPPQAKEVSLLTEGTPLPLLGT